MSYKVRSNVINLGLNPDIPVTLEKFLDESWSIPISLFEESSMINAINAARTYLEDKGEGAVLIPATDEYQHWVRLIATKDRLGNVRINFMTTDHRYPTIESRPYTDEPWELGDVIISNNIPGSLCIGWICTKTDEHPFRWEQFGHMKRWYSQLEKVEFLPDPSELQAERQLVYVDPESNQVDIYFCTQVPPSTDWEWVKMTIYDADIEAKVQQYYQTLIDGKLNQILLDVIAEYFDENPISNDVTQYFIDHPIKDTVKEYIDENPITTEVHTSLPADQWVGTDAPFTQTLVDERFAKAVSGMMSLGPQVPDNIVDEVIRAKMLISAQSGNSVTVSAYGIKPVSDIPLLIVLVNTNYAS